MEGGGWEGGRKRRFEGPRQGKLTGSGGMVGGWGWGRSFFFMRCRRGGLH